MTPVRGHGYSRTLLAFNRALEREYKPLCARYGVPFVEGFRAFYIVCAEAFSVNDGCEYMVGWYTFVTRANRRGIARDRPRLLGALAASSARIPRAGRGE